MASIKGRRTRWNAREQTLFLIDKRHVKKSREERQRERREERLHKVYASRREEAIRIVLAQAGNAPAFGLIWEPTLSWARGPSIWPFAQIFDDIVGHEWAVTVHHDIFDSGSPGWLFVRRNSDTQHT